MEHCRSPDGVTSISVRPYYTMLSRVYLALAMGFLVRCGETSATVRYAVPISGTASDVGGMVSATSCRNTVNDSRIVTPATNRDSQNLDYFHTGPISVRCYVARYMLSSCVCLCVCYCVCLSVTRW